MEQEIGQREDSEMNLQRPQIQRDGWRREDSSGKYLCTIDDQEGKR